MTEKDCSRKTDAKEAVLKKLKTLNYDYVKTLGEGRIGTVVEVKSPRSQQNIAVKIVLEKHLKENELKVWPFLSHPNIIQLISSNYIDAGRAYVFLMEKCVTSLEQRLGDPKFIFDPKAFLTSKYYVKGVLEGVSYLHQQNYAHMDLKLNNVLIDNEGKAVIADFDGITSTMEMSSSYGSPIPYRPPEAFCFANGDWGLVDVKKYDSWNLGMLCIRVFTRENFNTDIQLCKGFWEKIIYPKLYDILQRNRFMIKMKTCFPRSSFGFKDVDEVLGLIRSFLMVDPARRISPQDALNQKIFEGEEFHHMEENSPWQRKMDPRKLRNEIRAFSDRQRKLAVPAEICTAVVEAENKNIGVTEKPEKAEILKNVKKHSNEDKGKELDKNEKGVKMNIMPSRNNDVDNLKEKSDADETPSEITLSAFKLLKESQNHEYEGVYLRGNLETNVNECFGSHETATILTDMIATKEKRTQNFFAWAKEKKNSFLERFTRKSKR